MCAEAMSNAASNVAEGRVAYDFLNVSIVLERAFPYWQCGPTNIGQVDFLISMPGGGVVTNDQPPPSSMLVEKLPKLLSEDHGVGNGGITTWTPNSCNTTVSDGLAKLNMYTPSTPTASGTLINELLGSLKGGSSVSRLFGFK